MVGSTDLTSIYMDLWQTVEIADRVTLTHSIHNWSGLFFRCFGISMCPYKYPLGYSQRSLANCEEI
jgi:hypothetical protein